MSRGRRVSRKQFQRLVRKALEGLPQEFRLKLDNVAIVIEDEPPEDSPEVMGTYEGVPLIGRSSADPTLPDRITLFRGPIERACRTPEEMEAEVKLTLLHEVGHFFGLEEGQLK